MSGIGIDWVAVVVLGAAFIISNVRSIPQAVRHGVFAVACFGIAGYRVWRGATEGVNLIFVVLAVGIGVQYVVRALRAPKG